MATNRFGPQAVTIPVGTTTVGGATGVAIPDATNRIIFVIAIWPQPSRFLAVHYWQTFDNGVTWLDAGTQNPFPGSNTPAINPFSGQPVTNSEMTVDVLPGVNRRVRMDVTATGGSISTTVTIQTEP